MIRDGRQVTDGAVLTADVCIIGGGPAGLTVATELIRTGMKVVVLESGGDDGDPATQALAEGDVVGRPLLFNGVDMAPDMSRLRQLGGTSNHWTGFCRPLDAHDFEVRPAVPSSGWPISRAELDPYYARAVASCQLASERFDGAWWSDQSGTPMLTDGDPVRTVLFQVSPPTRFGPVLRPRLAASRDVDVYLWSNVTSIDTARDGGSVDRVRVATLSGRSWSVQADRFVLAVGGIEAPRILLASDGVDPAGVGNANDMVGRCFMDHPHVTGGRVLFREPTEAWRMYRIETLTLRNGKSELCWGGLSLSPDAQAAAGVGNASLHFWNTGAGPERADRDADWRSADAVGQLMGSPASTGVLTLRAEQAPNPDSRITLGEERDALGMRRPLVDWQLSPEDTTTIRTSLTRIAEHLAATGVARVEIDPGATAVEDWPIEIGNHHMGTTRMHADPEHGVVDGDCRMHQVRDLYVCGSSVFATSGMANPTLTIVALAHRLADHLRR